MKIDRITPSFFYLEETLQGGSSFKWGAIASQGRWQIWFTLEEEFENAPLRKGERVEATKLALSIWRSFSKYPCVCQPATFAHELAYARMGFVPVDDLHSDDWIYDPS